MASKKRFLNNPPTAHDEEENLWLVTYGDMMTLLLVFFILLSAIKTMNKVKVNDIVNSMSNAFGQKKLSEKEKKLLELRDSFGLAKKINLKELEDLNKVFSQISAIVKTQNLEKNISMSIDNRGVIIRASESIFFKSGQANLLKPGQKFLLKIVPVLQNTPYNILVEGHTDNVPIHTARFPTNWELSVARATTVVRFFIEKCKLDPRRFIASGYAEYRPLVPNNTPENRKKNRRVEIIILRTKYKELSSNE